MSESGPSKENQEEDEEFVAGAYDQLIGAMAGNAGPGHSISYGDVVIIRTEYSPEFWDLYTAQERGADLEWTDTLNLTAFLSVGELERELMRYVNDPEAEEADVNPGSERGFQ